MCIGRSGGNRFRTRTVRTLDVENCRYCLLAVWNSKPKWLLLSLKGTSFPRDPERYPERGGGGGKREGIRSQTTQTYLLTTETTLFNSFEHSSITETNEDSQINNWLIILQQSSFEIINTRRFKLIQDILIPTVFRELPSYFLIKHSALGEPLHNSQVLKNERLPKKMEAAIMARE